MTILVLLVIFFGALFMATETIGYLTQPIVTSPGILPLLVFGAAAAISGVMLILEFMRGNASTSRGLEALKSPGFRRHAAKSIGWLGLASGYAVATPVVGFTWATIVFLGIALPLFGRLVWWRTAIVAMAMAVLAPIAFRQLFFTIVP